MTLWGLAWLVGCGNPVVPSHVVDPAMVPLVASRVDQELGPLLPAGAVWVSTPMEGQWGPGAPTAVALAQRGPGAPIEGVWRQGELHGSLGPLDTDPSLDRLLRLVLAQADGDPELELVVLGEHGQVSRRNPQQPVHVVLDRASDGTVKRLRSREGALAGADSPEKVRQQLGLSIP